MDFYDTKSTELKDSISKLKKKATQLLTWANAQLGD